MRELDTGYFEIINRNHRYDVIQSLNIPDVMVCNLGKISETRAKRLAIELNETSFSNGNQILASIFKEISKEFGIRPAVRRRARIETHSGIAHPFCVLRGEPLGRVGASRHDRR